MEVAGFLSVDDNLEYAVLVGVETDSVVHRAGRDVSQFRYSSTTVPFLTVTATQKHLFGGQERVSENME